MADKLKIEVVYARPERQVILPVLVDEGTSARTAIEVSGILDEFPEIDLAQVKIGIFSKAIAQEQVLRDGDRVEIYRPLIADPKESRRQRADKTKPAS